MVLLYLFADADNNNPSSNHRWTRLMLMLMFICEPCYLPQGGSHGAGRIMALMIDRVGLMTAWMVM
jgi:hypothetical protein